MIRYSFVTNKGSIYCKNEDSLFLVNKALQKDDAVKSGMIFKKNFFACIFDGVGGADFGNIASYTCACKMKEISISSTFTRTTFMDVIDSLNNTLLEKRKEFKNVTMLTTISAVYVNKNVCHFCNVGDSRLYFFDGQVLEIKSVDDTLKNKLLKEGKVGKEEIDKIDVEHKITNCLGKKDFDKYKFHYFNSEIQKGNRIILMSDGISDLLSDKELLSLLKSNRSIKKIGSLIKDIIDSRGAHDNYSLIILEA